MSAHTAQDARAVLSRLAWVRSGEAPARTDQRDWQAAAQELFDTLGMALGQLEAAGLCRGCGKPLGAYCLECAWPHKRRSERRQDS